MNRPRFLIAILALALAGLSAAFGADTLTPADLKKRMAARLATLDALKATGKLGENNLGYLTAREKLAKKEALIVTAENNDRKRIYTVIAKKAGEKAEIVGKKRAAALRKSSKKGLWLQDTKGSWYKKV